MENGPFIVDFPIKHGDFPWLFVCSPEGILARFLQRRAEDSTPTCGGIELEANDLCRDTVLWAAGGGKWRACTGCTGCCCGNWRYHPSEISGLG